MNLHELIETYVTNHQSSISHDPCPVGSVPGTYGARTTVLPLHPATFSLAQAQGAAARRCCPFSLRQPASPHVPPERGHNHLSTPGASVNAPFLAPFSSSAFIGNKPSVYLRETPTFFTTNPRLLDAFTLSHFHISVSGFHIPAKKSY